MNTKWVRWMIVVFLACLMASPTWADERNYDTGQKASGKKSKARAASSATTDDASITATLMEKFSNSASLKDTPIDVSVKDGAVTLSGKVKYGRQKGSATRMAKAVPGVKSVDNQLVVENPNGSSPRGKNKSKKSAS